MCYFPSVTSIAFYLDNVTLLFRIRQAMPSGSTSARLSLRGSRFRCLQGMFSGKHHCNRRTGRRKRNIERWFCGDRPGIIKNSFSPIDFRERPGCPAQGNGANCQRGRRECHGKKGLQSRCPANRLVELVRCWNDIHLLGQDGLLLDPLHRLKVSLCNGQHLLGFRYGLPTSLDLASRPR